VLESLRLPVQTRPGLLIFAAETIKLWLTSQQQHIQPQRSYIRAVEILLWLAEASTTADDQINSAAFTSFVNLLAEQPQQQPDQESILATVFHHFHTFSVGIKLQAMKLIGLCCQNPESSVLYAYWSALENILCNERHEEVLHITACALFEGIASHAATPNFSSCSNTHQNDHYHHQIRATVALEKGLACPMPSIQFPVAVAAGKIMVQQHFWQEGFLERIATASEQAYRIQQDRVGAWGAWQPDAGATAVSVLQVPACRKITAQHVLAVLEIVHNEHVPINRET